MQAADNHHPVVPMLRQHSPDSFNRLSCSLSTGAGYYMLQFHGLCDHPVTHSFGMVKDLRTCRYVHGYVQQDYIGWSSWACG